MGYTIKEVSEKFNITPYTLRFYEKEGLLPSIQREGNGHRLYTDTDLEWIRIVCCMRSTGMSIEYIKKYIDLCILGENTIPERRQIILCQKEIIEKHINEYKQLLKVVNRKLKHYDDLADETKADSDSGEEGADNSHPLKNSGQTCYVYDTAIGKITIAADDRAITAVTFGAKTDLAECRRTELTDLAATQLEEYLAGKRREFDIPLSPKGTPFQELVWNALCNIPYGETRSYKQIAESIGNPNACRAVGMANNRNPIAIMVPCHRVVGADESLVGYAGGLEIKKRLLELEGSGHRK